MQASRCMKLFRARVRCNQMFPESRYLWGPSPSVPIPVTTTVLTLQSFLSAPRWTSIELCNNVFTTWLQYILCELQFDYYPLRESALDEIIFSSPGNNDIPLGKGLWRPLKNPSSTYICVEVTCIGINFKDDVWSRRVEEKG